MRSRLWATYVNVSSTVRFRFPPPEPPLPHPRQAEPLDIGFPSAGCVLATIGVGRIMQIRQEMNEIQDGNEPQRQQVHLVERPVISLAVTNAGLPLDLIQ